MNPSQYPVLGMMSGTSLDGLDLALCFFSKDGNQWHYMVDKAETIAYPPILGSKLSMATELSGWELTRIDIDLGNFMADAVNIFLKTTTCKPLLLASHGHTVFHRPDLGITTQIGNGAVLAAKTGIRTVCDFRSLDVALGGQGAPLVPIGDQLLFGNYDFCLNLGGFCNISYNENGQRRAFDIAPCNMALNTLAEQKGAPYDADGKWARTGNRHIALWNELNQLDYYRKEGTAKSLGKEWYDCDFAPLMAKYDCSSDDKLRTVTEHIAFQIGKVLEYHAGAQVLLTGGGALNTFLVESIQKETSKKVVIPDLETINFKEAIIFAFLGLLRRNDEINVLQSVTGARQDCSSGAVY